MEELQPGELQSKAPQPEELQPEEPQPEVPHSGATSGHTPASALYII